jgi:hypothetical protein
METHQFRLRINWVFIAGDWVVRAGLPILWLTLFYHSRERKINVGWVERSETQQCQGLWVLGCAVLNPTYVSIDIVGDWGLGCFGALRQKYIFRVFPNFVTV